MYEKTINASILLIFAQSAKAQVKEDSDLFLTLEKQDRKPIRKLEKGSLKVFPMYYNGVLYAAIQCGIHHFYLREDGKEDLWTSAANSPTSGF